jgi:uncharacterized protein
MTTLAKEQVGLARDKSTLEQEKGQYTLWQILAVWLAAGAPMWVLGWLVYPAMSVGLSAAAAGLLRFKLLTVGLVWEFVLAMFILYYEEGNLRLSTIRRRFWLNQPRDAAGNTRKSLWWWIIPLILLVAVMDLALRPVLIRLTGTFFPLFAQPAGYDGSALFAPELRAQWVGAWGLLGLLFVEGIFNTFLGEEFIFRGVLLPKMKGVFGKWDWLANGVVFGLYHLHQPWGILSSILTGSLYAYSSKHFRSNWFSIILHSGQTVYLLFLILGLVLGLA